MAFTIVGADLGTLRQLVDRLGKSMRSQLYETLDRMNTAVQDSSEYWVAGEGDKFRTDFDGFVRHTKSLMDEALADAARVSGQNLGAITQATTSEGPADSPPSGLNQVPAQSTPHFHHAPPVQKVIGMMNGAEALLRDRGLAQGGTPWLWQRAVTPALKGAQDAFDGSKLESLLWNAKLGSLAKGFENFAFKPAGLDGFSSLPALAKGTVPLQMIFGAKEAILGNGHTGAYNIADHLMGGVSVVGGGAVLFGSAEAGLLGVAALTPGVGWALLGAAGAYALGSWAWDNRAAIGHFAESAWRGSVDLAKNTWNTLDDIGSTAVRDTTAWAENTWNTVGDLGSSAVNDAESAASDVTDFASSAAKDVGNVASSAVDGAKNVGSSVVHGIGSAIGSIF